MSRIFLLLIVVVISCNTSHNKRGEQSFVTDSTKILNPTFQVLELNAKVEDAINKFVDEDTCKNCIHEIYIDKIRPPRTEIVLRSRVYSVEYMRKINPLFITRVKGIDFYVFSGLEDVFIGDKKNTSKVEGDSTATNFKIWTLIILNDSVQTIKNVGQPFFPYSVPNIEIK